MSRTIEAGTAKLVRLAAVGGGCADRTPQWDEIEMTALTSYGEAVGQLSEPARLAFACGCAEHVIPLFEQLFEGQPLREAVDAAWAAVLGGPLSRVQA